VDSALVAKSRFFVDSLEAARALAAEFLIARAEGSIGDDHMLGEIGSVAPVRS
jgi:ornithine cyclodeaminase/alanine dehydrogenase-like protein (mu-crystallin family)